MKRFSFSSLRFKLILLVLIAVIPALGLTFYSGIEQRRHARFDALDNALNLTKKVSNDQEHLIERTHQLLVALAQMEQALQCQSSGYSPFLARLVKEYSIYTNLGTTGPDGQVICSALPMKQPTNFADREWFPRILHTRKFTVSEYLIGRITGKPSIVLSYPILAGTDHLKAVVFASLDLAWLNQIAAKAQLPLGSVLMVLDRKGTILARYPDPEKWVGRSMSDTPIVKTILTRQGEGTVEMADIDGVLRLSAFTPLSNRAEVGAYVSVGIPSTVAFAEANRTIIRNLTWLGIMAALAFVAAWFIGGLFIVHPVNRLLNVTNRLANRDLAARLGPSYVRGEIGELACSFDRMAESLENREAERKRAEDSLRESEKRYRLLVESVKDYAIFMLDAEGHIASWNYGAEQIKGYKTEEIIGKHFSIFYTPEDIEIGKPERELQKVIVEGRAEGEGYRVRKDGSRFWASVVVTPLYDEAGKIYGFTKVTRDITARKQVEEELRKHREHLEKLVEQRTAELSRTNDLLEKENAERKQTEEDLRKTMKKLESSNKELEQFSYIASHDLQEPLRVITSYLQLLEKRYKGNLDPDGDKYIGRVIEGAVRMRTLINDLLAYSRVGTRGKPFEPVDSGVVLEDVLSNLRIAIEGSGGILTSDPLPKVSADPTQLGQLFQNLIGNAIKFRRGEVLRIQISAERNGNEWIFSVRDNGIGIEREYADRIFGVFQRLHTRKEYPGTGIGLAICKKIVERQGGRIWVESESGKGSTFFFIIPDRGGTQE